MSTIPQKRPRTPQEGSHRMTRVRARRTQDWEGPSGISNDDQKALARTASLLNVSLPELLRTYQTGSQDSTAPLPASVISQPRNISSGVMASPNDVVQSQLDQLNRQPDLPTPSVPLLGSSVYVEDSSCLNLNLDSNAWQSFPIGLEDGYRVILGDDGDAGELLQPAAFDSALGWEPCLTPAPAYKSPESLFTGLTTDISPHEKHSPVHAPLPSASTIPANDTEFYQAGLEPLGGSENIANPSNDSTDDRNGSKEITATVRVEEVDGKESLDQEYGHIQMIQTTRQASVAFTGGNSPFSVTVQRTPEPSVLLNTDDHPDLEFIQWKADQLETRSRQQRRGPFQDAALRQQTADTRKLKACVRCRMQKIRCQASPSDPAGVCVTCQAVSGSQRVYSLPCLRYRVTECTVYRTGRPPGMDFTFRWPVMKLKDISDWSSTETRTIQVLSDVCPVPLELSVRKFKPTSQDSLHRAWMDGKVKKFKEVTPYAIVDISATAAYMRQFISTNVFASWDHFMEKGGDELILITSEFAKKHLARCQHSDDRHLMRIGFLLMAATRRSFTIEHISGDDKLDMEPEMTDKSYPLFGKVPLPPVMIQQLDMILTLGVLVPLRKQFLEELQRLTMLNRPTSWMTIYLICFFSLQACAAVSDHHYKNARKHGLKACLPSINRHLCIHRRYLTPTFIAERQHSANVHLSHFHYCTQPCNPFTLEWKHRQSTPFADMTPDEILFIEATKRIVKKKKEEFDTLRELELCEHPLYFVSQLYEENWSPRDTIIEYSNATVQDVPLAKYHRD